MSRRHYVNNAPQLTLASPITSGSTSCTVSGTFSGWPVLFPFYATLDLGLLAEEIVLVTAIVGSTATITRGQDGTAAVSHTSGATLNFTVGAADFDEANAHVNANTGVHGISGSVVGTSDNQTLTNKTLTNPTINGANVSGTFAGTIGASGLTFTSPNLTTPNSTKSTHTGDATTAALTAVAGASGTKILSLRDNTSTEVATVNALTGFNGVVTLKSFTNEAAATSAGANTTGAIVWLTAPTTGASAGPFQYNGTTWKPLVPSRDSWSAHNLSNGTHTTSGSYLTINVDTIDDDTAGLGVSGGGLANPPIGTYLVYGTVSFGANATGRRGAQITVNGVAVPGTKTLFPATASGASQVTTGVGIAVVTAANQPILLQGLQESGGSLTTNAGQNQLTVVRLS